jgi:hypothetical protein
MNYAKPGSRHLRLFCDANGLDIRDVKVFGNIFGLIPEDKYLTADQERELLAAVHRQQEKEEKKKTVIANNYRAIRCGRCDRLNNFEVVTVSKNLVFWLLICENCRKKIDVTRYMLVESL